MKQFILVPAVLVLMGGVGHSGAPLDDADFASSLKGVRAALVALEGRGVDLSQPHFLTVSNSVGLVVMEAIPALPGATGEEKLVIRMRADPAWREESFEDTRTTRDGGVSPGKNAQALADRIRLCLETVRRLNPKAALEEFSVSYGRGNRDDTWTFALDHKPWLIHGGYLLEVGPKNTVKCEAKGIRARWAYQTPQDAD